jgi:HAD superfamily hydrolase (TIGR01490 family)
MTGDVTLVVFDLDGTITRHDTTMPFLFGYLVRHPWRVPRLVAVLPAALRFVFGAHDRGALKGALLHHALGGLPHRDIDQWAARFTARLCGRGLFAEALQAIGEHRAAGHHLVLMSASVDCYVPRIGALLGFAETICTKVRWNADGTLDGRLASANLRDQEKARQLQALQARLQPTATIAYGNSTTDLPHLRLASEGFFINGRAVTIPSDGANIKVVEWRD